MQRKNESLESSQFLRDRRSEFRDLLRDAAREGGGVRLGGGGGNFFRTVNYQYPSVLPRHDDEVPAIKSDKGLRDSPKEHLITADGVPHLGRVAQRHLNLAAMPRDLAPRSIVGTHPLEVLADKLDAVCWREGLVPMEGEDTFSATVERAKQQERALRSRIRPTRPERDRPKTGYTELRAWTTGTPENAALSKQYPQLRSIVFGDLPSFDDVCEIVASAEGII